MTVIRPNSVSGINSITAQANEIKIFKSDGTQGGLMIDGANLNATSGISTVAALTVTGNVSVGGTLTYQDVTNIDSVGIITARNAIVISDDNAIHFRGTAADDNDAILRASAGGGQLLINSRNDTIINIDSNNDSTDAHFAVAHGAATGSSTELFRVQEDGKVAVGFNAPAVAGLSIANSSTSLGFEFDTASGFAGGPTIRGYHRPSTAYKSLGITGADIKFGINDVEKLRLDSNGYLGLNNSAPHNQYYNNLVIGDGSASGDKGITIRTQSSNEGVIAFSDADSGAARYAGKIAYNHGTNAMMFFTSNGDERLRITSDGATAVGNASQMGSNYARISIDCQGRDVLTDVTDITKYGLAFHNDPNTNDANGIGFFNDDGTNCGGYILHQDKGSNNLGDLIFATSATSNSPIERLRITSSGITQQKDLSGNYHVIASSRDGSTSARAATSAWEIKKTLGPDAKTGYYYLTNPYDSTTQQWWCDMETDGGGWILVAFTGDGQMGSNLGNWYDRNNKGGFNGLAQGFYRGGGYWNTWGDLKGQLMWECRTLDTYFNSSSCSKVGINWGKNNNLPTAGTRALSNITGNANTLFENWCWDIYNAPGFEPSNYSSAARNNRIGGANYFTEHMVITWSFRSTGGSADDGSNGPYWMIGAHHDGLHQHYEESLSGSDGVNGDGGYQVSSNEDTSWGSGGQQYSMNRLARHNQDGGSVFVWMR